MDKKIFKIMALFACCVLVSCKSTDYSNFFVSEEKIDNSKYEYVADVLVVKKGFKLFWFIPFGFGDKDSARDIMVDRTRKRFPGAAGIYVFKVVDGPNPVSLIPFSWVPSITISGKIVKKRT